MNPTKSWIYEFMYEFMYFVFMKGGIYRFHLNSSLEKYANTISYCQHAQFSLIFITWLYSQSGYKSSWRVPTLFFMMAVFIAALLLLFFLNRSESTLLITSWIKNTHSNRPKCDSMMHIFSKVIMYEISRLIEYCNFSSHCRVLKRCNDNLWINSFVHF